VSNISFDDRPTGYRCSSNPRSETRPYILTGVLDRPTARIYAAGATPVIAGGLWRQNIEVTNVGHDIWDVDVTYGPYGKKEQQSGDFKWGFDSTGGTKHITQGIRHVDGFFCDASMDGFDSNPYDGSINVNENNEVEGVDVIDKAFKWTENRQLELADFAWSYAQIIDQLTGTVNDAPFRGFEEGSVLFEGAQGQFSAKDPTVFDVTYHFNRSRPITDGGPGSTIGDSVHGIKNIEKKGWEYLWVHYITVNGTKELGKKAWTAYVEQVYDSGDFSLLGIGTEALLLPVGFPGSS
jgi:hypothetical protein